MWMGNQVGERGGSDAHNQNAFGDYCYFGFSNRRESGRLLLGRYAARPIHEGCTVRESVQYSIESPSRTRRTWASLGCSVADRWCFAPQNGCLKQRSDEKAQIGSPVMHAVTSKSVCAGTGHGEIRS